LIEVRKVANQTELEQIFKIREEVFVKEQEVAPEDEYDEFEKTSTHFLATVDGVACGTARWRQTEKGIKLERFAVLKNYRNSGVGQEILRVLLADIEEDPNVSEQKKYMHAQTIAIPFYKKFGFETIGDEFTECGIKHYLMEK